MDRTVQVARVWSWLPAFRVVAETQHLPTASAILHITASSLSRTIRLLEAEMGVELFRRVGRRIELNEAGAEFLHHVRDAMRRVHTGLERAHDQPHAGAVHISSGGVMTLAVVQPALKHLARAHPDLVPHVHSHAPSDCPPLLLRGQLDIAFLSQSITHDRLTTRHLGEFSSGVYCGRGHPLHRVKRPSRRQVLSHAFAAPTPDSTGQTAEGWPGHVKRQVALYASQMDVGVRACATGRMLAVLPDAVAKASGLRRLPFDGIDPAQMYAVHRPFISEGSRAESVLEAVEAHLGL